MTPCRKSIFLPRLLPRRPFPRAENNFMDRKSIFVLVGCFALLFLGSRLIEKMYPPTPLPAGVRGATNSLGAVETTLSNNIPPATLSAADTNRVLTPLARVRPLTGPEQTLVVSNALARYTFTSR